MTNVAKIALWEEAIWKLKELEYEILYDISIDTFVIKWHGSTIVAKLPTIEQVHSFLNGIIEGKVKRNEYQQ